MLKGKYTPQVKRMEESTDHPPTPSIKLEN
jgi:hypothetical protein